MTPAARVQAAIEVLDAPEIDSGFDEARREVSQEPRGVDRLPTEREPRYLRACVLDAHSPLGQRNGLSVSGGRGDDDQRMGESIRLEPRQSDGPEQGYPVGRGSEPCLRDFQATHRET